MPHQVLEAPQVSLFDDFATSIVHIRGDDSRIYHTWNRCCGAADTTRPQVGVRHPPAVSLVAGFEQPTGGANTTQDSPVVGSINDLTSAM